MIGRLGYYIFWKSILKRTVNNKTQDDNQISCEEFDSEWGIPPWHGVRIY